MKRNVKLYNVMFPLWMFFLLPTVVWLIILPVNFAVDTLVMLLVLGRLGLQNRKQIWKQSILRIWLYGFLADFLGAALTMALLLLCDKYFYVSMEIPYGQLLVLPGIALAGVFIYLLNRQFSFEKCGLDGETIRKLSLALAVFTAPYTMLWPIEWMYF